MIASGPGCLFVMAFPFRGWLGMLRDAAEPGGADALAGEALGLVGGDFGGAGENLGQQVQQMRAFLVAEGGQDALLQGAYAGEQLVGGARPSGVISIRVLRRSSGFGMRRIQPRCSSRSLQLSARVSRLIQIRIRLLYAVIS